VEETPPFMTKRFGQNTFYVDDALVFISPRPLGKHVEEIVQYVELGVVGIQLAHEHEHDFKRDTHEKTLLVAVTARV
jgi:hypothetical protein